MPECHRLTALAAGQTSIGRLRVPTNHASGVVAINLMERDSDVCVRVGPRFTAHAVAGQMMAAPVDRVDRSEGNTGSAQVRDLDRLTKAPDLDEVVALAHSCVGSPGTRLIAIRQDLATGRRFEFLPPP